jgi:hypothetical protein
LLNLKVGFGVSLVRRGYLEAINSERRKARSLKEGSVNQSTEILPDIDVTCSMLSAYSRVYTRRAESVM